MIIAVNVTGSQQKPKLKIIILTCERVLINIAAALLCCPLHHSHYHLQSKEIHLSYPAELRARMPELTLTQATVGRGMHRQKLSPCMIADLLHHGLARLCRLLYVTQSSVSTKRKVIIISIFHLQLPCKVIIISIFHTPLQSNNNFNNSLNSLIVDSVVIICNVPLVHHCTHVEFLNRTDIAPTSKFSSSPSIAPTPTFVPELKKNGTFGGDYVQHNMAV